MPRRRAVLALVPIAALAVAGLAACGSSSAGSASKGSLRMLGVEPTQGFDPNKAFADASRVPMAMIYETLTERNDSGDIVGSLASKWDESSDGKTYTFTLRDGIEFSDGSAITPADVKFSLERAKTGDVLKAQLAAITSITTSGDHTVTIKLSHPMSTFTSLVGRPANAAILSEKTVNANKNYFTKPAVTSGPWTLTEYTPKSRMVFTANTHYYSVPKIKTITVTFGTDPAANAGALESGSADVASIAYSDVKTLESQGSINIVQSDQLAPLFFGWNTSKPPFDNLQVRQAVAWAIDREGKQKACWFNTGAVTYGNLLRPWDPDYVELDNYKTSSQDEAIAKADDLLDQAGWTRSGDGTRTASGVDGVDDGKSLSFDVEYESNWPAAACHVQLLQQDLKKVGIDAKPKSYDPAAYWGDAAKNKFVMYHGGAGAADGMDLYTNWFKTGGSLTALTTHLDNPAINAKITQAEQASPGQAKQIIQNLERWQAENLPLLVDGYQWPQVGMTKRVHNYKPGVDTDSRTLVEAWVD